MASSATLASIGLLDERFSFYFADDDYALSLRRLNIKHALALRSHVYHLEDRKITLNPRPADLKGLAKIPRYLLIDRYRWILQSDDMLNGYFTFRDKWGSYPSISLRKKLHDFLFLKLKIRFLSQFLFSPNQHGRSRLHMDSSQWHITKK
jgi:GT2 family glycosyltransferase